MRWRGHRQRRGFRLTELSYSPVQVARMCPPVRGQSHCERSPGVTPNVPASTFACLAYTLGYHQILPYLCCCSNRSPVVPWELFLSAPELCDTPPSMPGFSGGAGPREQVLTQDAAGSSACWRCRRVSQGPQLLPLEESRRHHAAPFLPSSLRCSLQTPPPPLLPAEIIPHCPHISVRGLPSPPPRKLL